MTVKVPVRLVLRTDVFAISSCIIDSVTKFKNASNSTLSRDIGLDGKIR